MNIKSNYEHTSHDQSRDSTLVDSLEVERVNAERVKAHFIQADYSINSVDESESLLTVKKKKHKKKKHDIQLHSSDVIHEEPRKRERSISTEDNFQFVTPTKHVAKTKKHRQTSTLDGSSNTFVHGQNMFESEISLEQSSPGLDIFLSEIDVDNPFDDSEIISVKKKKKKRKNRDKVISLDDLGDNINEETTKDSDGEMKFTKVKKKKKHTHESATDTILREVQERLHASEDDVVNSTIPKRKKRKKSKTKEGDSTSDTFYESESLTSAHDDSYSRNKSNSESIPNGRRISVDSSVRELSITDGSLRKGEKHIKAGSSLKKHSHSKESTGYSSDDVDSNSIIPDRCKKQTESNSESDTFIFEEKIKKSKTKKGEDRTKDTLYESESLRSTHDDSYSRNKSIPNGRTTSVDGSIRDTDSNSELSITDGPLRKREKHKKAGSSLKKHSHSKEREHSESTGRSSDIVNSDSIFPDRCEKEKESNSESDTFIFDAKIKKSKRKKGDRTNDTFNESESLRSTHDKSSRDKSNSESITNGRRTSVETQCDTSAETECNSSTQDNDSKSELSTTDDNSEEDNIKAGFSLKKHSRSRKRRQPESTGSSSDFNSSIPNGYPRCKKERESDCESDISISEAKIIYQEREDSDNVVMNDSTLNSSINDDSDMESPLKEVTGLKHESDLNESNSSESSSNDDNISENISSSSSKTFNKKIDKFDDIDWKLPPLHIIVNRASLPTRKQRDIIKSRKLKVKSGKFIKVEDEQIIKNWKRFVEVNNVSEPPEKFFQLDKQFISKHNKSIFLLSLGRNLPERTLYSVFRRFKILTSKNLYKTGRFTEEEEHYIRECLKNSKESYLLITKMAKHLNRPRTSVENHVRLMKQNFHRTIKWRKKNAAVLIKYLLKYTKTSEENIHELRNKRITIEQWRKVSSKLDGVPVKILKTAWYEKLHTGLFIPKPLVLSKVKRKLVEMFCENEESDLRSIDWKKYAARFDGLSHYHIYQLFFQAVTAHVPHEKRSDLKACLKILKHVNWKNAKRKTFDKIVYEDGKIRVVENE